MAKVVYFTRSPDPPSSPSIVATNGSSVRSGVTTPSSHSSTDDIHSHSKKVNGALTPLVLENNNGHTNGFPGVYEASLEDRSYLRDAIVRRASLRHFPGGSLNFERFETDNIDECVTFIQELIERSAHVNAVSIADMRRGVKIIATGGGAHRFFDTFSSTLGVEVIREDEMECLIEGLKFITMIPDEVYYFSDELVQQVSRPGQTQKQGKLDGPTSNSAPPPSQGADLERPSPNPPQYGITFESNPSPQLPCLLVNIGSGVSIIKVDEDGKFERISGTSLGGGTLWGLLSLLTPAQSFDGKLSIFPCHTHCT